MGWAARRFSEARTQPGSAHYGRTSCSARRKRPKRRSPRCWGSPGSPAWWRGCPTGWRRPSG